MIISLIVAMSKNRVIGVNGTLPWHLPADLKHFKKVTMGKPIVMGRKTFESIGKPLPGRKNVVVTKNKDFFASGVEVVYSLDEAFEHLKNESEVFVIGGEAIFRQSLSKADRLFLTEIEMEVAGDTFMPPFESEFIERSRERFVEGDIAFSFVLWGRP